jgi:hypothetical protein
MCLTEGSGQFLETFWGDIEIMNYQYYHRQVITKCPSCDIWVVRTEKLWDDISHIDKLLGGHTNFQ